MVAKAEWLPGAGGGNPRFVVTSLDRQTIAKQALYEEHCARGDMENRIKEQQLWLFADRTSTATMRANQLREYFSAFAGITDDCPAPRGTAGNRACHRTLRHIRARLIKLAGRIKVSVRTMVRISLSSVYPLQELFDRRSPPCAPSPFALPRCASHLDSARRSEHETHRRRPDQGDAPMRSFQRV